jgi:hypothetical protein
MPGMPQPGLPFFRDLNFGLLDAHEEATTHADLFRGGYYDFKEAATRVRQREAWALIGPKGAGKTAVLEYLRLEWEGNPLRFVDRWNLGQFPVADVTNIQVGGLSGPSAVRAAWQFLLLLRVFESLMRDQGRSEDRGVRGLQKDLTKAGLIGGSDLRTRFGEWTSTTVEYQVAGLGGSSTYEEHGATPVQIVEVLQAAMERIETSSQHVIAIDGLDSFFEQSDAALESLAALVDSIAALNIRFVGLALPVTIVFAIRKDMFDRLPSTDSGKMTAHSVNLDWSNKGAGESNQLWNLLNSKVRAAISSGHQGQKPKDIRKDYLQRPIGIRRWRSIPDYFTEHTRLLPRDMIALMHSLQQVHTGPGPVAEVSATSAIRLYAEGYFKTEVTNGLSRVLPNSSAQQVPLFMSALSTLQSPFFTLKDVEEELAGALTTMELRALLSQLFDIGGIGMRVGTGPKYHTNFAYRRIAGGGFRLHGTFRLHYALEEAWNVPHEG